MDTATIDTTTVFRKTARGRMEIGQRVGLLSPERRRILILVDGQKDLAAIATLFSRTDIDEVAEYLWQEGFIEPVAGSAAPAAGAQHGGARVPDPAFDAFRKTIAVRPVASPPATAIPEPVKSEPAVLESEPAAAPTTDGGLLAQAQAVMVDSVQAYIGLLGSRLIARIEGAASLDELGVVASQWHVAIRESKRGRPEADRLLATVRGLLGASGETVHPA